MTTPESLEKPIILRQGEYTAADLERLKKTRLVRQTRDLYRGQLAELFAITHFALRPAPEFQTERAGNWVYFPWSGELVHTVTEEEHFLLRTNRNKNLITADEQRKLFDFTVGVAGLSIGNGIALSLAHSGIANTMKLAEFDEVATTNLNRLRAGLSEVGIPKLAVTSRQIYEINPYADLSLFPQGLRPETLTSFVSEFPQPRLIFEAIDDFEMKIRVRLAARGASVPVIMLTNLGDNLLIDVERYDLDGTLPLFNGLLGALPDEILAQPITEEDKQKYAVKIVGLENVPQRALESVREIGKTLVGRPQLASTVTVAGGVAAYLARRIALGEDVPSGRRLVKFQEIF